MKNNASMEDHWSNNPRFKAEPPPECQTEAEKTAFAFGWFKALEQQRLAQPEQEPVAWGVFDGLNLHDMLFTEEEAQEMVRLKGDRSNVKPLYTTPPQRTWIGLTDEEIDGCDWGQSERDHAKAVEAKLKEKNT